jgi:hypothetical protein
MNHMCSSHAHTFKACGPRSPCSLIRSGSQSSLWLIFNEYEVTSEDIAWFLKDDKETKVDVHHALTMLSLER